MVDLNAVISLTAEVISMIMIVHDQFYDDLETDNPFSI